MDRPIMPEVNGQADNKCVSDEMIEYYFRGTNFGANRCVKSQRKLLANGVLKCQAGYWNGHTLYQIMKACCLVSKNDNVTKRGRLFIYQELSTSKA